MVLVAVGGEAEELDGEGGVARDLALVAARGDLEAVLADRLPVEVDAKGPLGRRRGQCDGAERDGEEGGTAHALPYARTAAPDVGLSPTHR